ncbi:UDP-glucuronosyltransferase 1-1 [Desmophyllum pertusum]|uniref:UDP-glucuronosyltransferase 1-1 n=1 Tax=Desmophyllum pertusum TaxID=174260 RepID=A0A9W9YKE8_9CNID|nr:UDP-glucuronosyltransferase 1-1 [Desmophyllum pertusum]
MPPTVFGLDDRMSFTDRLTNWLGFYSLMSLVEYFMFPAMDKVKQQYDIKPEVSTAEGVGKAELVLVQNSFCFGFPRPLTPGNLLSSKTSNIKAVDWMPQNDVLGHVKTKVFLSHLGHNSMYEAAYHGVPIVGFPMWSDQPKMPDKSHEREWGSG